MNRIQSSVSNLNETIIWTISERCFTYFQSVLDFHHVSHANPTLIKLTRMDQSVAPAGRNVCRNAIHPQGPSPSGAKCVSLKTVQTMINDSIVCHNYIRMTTKYVQPNIKYGILSIKFYRGSKNG